MATHFGDHVHVSTLTAGIGVGVLPGSDAMPELGSAGATSLPSDVVVRSVTDCKSIYTDSLYFRGLSAICLAGRNAIMYDRRNLRRKTEIDGWHRHEQVMQSYCPSCGDPIGPLDSLTVRHKVECNYMTFLDTLVEHTGSVRVQMNKEAFCLDQPYDPYYLIWNEDAWSQELRVELEQSRELAHRLLGEYNNEAIALIQADRGCFKASRPDIYCLQTHSCILPAFFCIAAAFL